VDFNGDGVAEVYTVGDPLGISSFIYGSVILNAETGKTIIEIDKAIHVVGDLLPDGFCPDCGGLEVVTHRTTKNPIIMDTAIRVYSIDIDNQRFTPISQYNFEKDSIFHSVSSLADFDGDSQLDVLTSYMRLNDSLWIMAWNPRTNTVFRGPKAFGFKNFFISNDAYPSPPLVTNLDNDSELEIAFLSRSTGSNTNSIVALDNDFSQMWSTKPLEFSPMTLIAFDFLGDGIPEILYRGEAGFLFAFDGQTGQVLDSLPCYSATFSERPVSVADLNDDDVADITCVCWDDVNSFSVGEIRVFGPATCSPWVSSRKVVNQYSYNPMHINDDLSVPTQVQNKALSKKFNNAFVQFPYMDTAGNPVVKLQADLYVSVSQIQYNNCQISDSAIITLSICNQGCETALAGLPISFYDGNPLVSGTLIASGASSATILMDSCISQSFTISITDSMWLYAYVNDSGNIPLLAPLIAQEECFVDNNYDSTYIILPIPLVLSASASLDSICIGSITSLSINGGDSTAIYYWSPGLSLDDSTSINPQASPLLSTQYIAFGLDTLANCFDSDTLFVWVDSVPAINLGMDTIICNNDITISISAMNGVSYLWSSGDTGASITIHNSGVYTVTANGHICSSSDSINVSTCSVLYIPNAFSPNGDGKNDFLRLWSQGVKTLRWSVYDRWGNRVFRANGIIDSWDGTYLGKSAIDGVYVYYIKGQYLDGKEINIKGNVTLVR